MASRFSDNDDSILTGQIGTLSPDGASLTPVIIAPPSDPPIPLKELPEPHPFDIADHAVHTETATTTRRSNGDGVVIVFGVFFVAILMGLGLVLFFGCGCCRCRRTRRKTRSIDDDGSKPIQHLRVVPDGGPVGNDFRAYPASHAVPFAAAATATADATATATTVVAAKVMHTNGTETNHRVTHVPSFMPLCPVDTGMAASAACAVPADAGSF